LPFLEAKKVKPARYDDLAVAYDKLGKEFEESQTLMKEQQKDDLLKADKQKKVFGY
jgi:hypothetical protein